MRKAIVRIIPALLVCAALHAQSEGPPPPPPGGPHGFHMGEMGPGGPGFGFHKVVTGAPFSADVTDSVSQTLADGNTIQHTTTGHIARDAQGRTYMQHTINGGPLAENGPKTITFLSDPVAGYSYVLDATTKTAIRRALKPPPSAGATADDSTPPPPHQHPADANRVETDLGTQNINGVNAQGKSITHTIPAGQMGNTKPLVSTSETWYSPDLQIPVLAKHSDPRSGQSVYTLTNIQRGAPAASLFQVPSDYTITEAPAHGPHHPGEPQ